MIQSATHAFSQTMRDIATLGIIGAALAVVALLLVVVALWAFYKSRHKEVKVNQPIIVLLILSLAFTGCPVKAGPFCTGFVTAYEPVTATAYFFLDGRAAQTPDAPWVKDYKELKVELGVTAAGIKELCANDDASVVAILTAVGKGAGLIGKVWQMVRDRSPLAGPQEGAPAMWQVELDKAIDLEWKANEALKQETK